MAITQYATFLLVGLATSVPFSAVMNSSRVFQGRLDTAFFSHYSAVYLTVKFVFSVAAVWFLRIPPAVGAREGEERMKRTTTWAMCGLLIASVLNMALAGWKDLAGTWLYGSMLLLALTTSFLSGIVDTGTSAIAGQHSSNAMQALFVGHSIAGLLSAAMSFVLTFFFNRAQRLDTFALCNFGFALLIVLIATILWKRNSSVAGLEHNAKDGLASQHPHALGTLRKISDLALAVFSSAAISMVLWPYFPANTISTRSDDPSAAWWQGRMFVPFAFLVSALGDLLGKLAPAIPSFHRSALPFLPLCLARLVLVPVYLMGNLRIPGRHIMFPPLLANDLLYLVCLCFLSSAANGYLGTMANMAAMERVPAEQRSTATMIMSFCGHYGALVGILASTIMAVVMQVYISVPITNAR